MVNRITFIKPNMYGSRSKGALQPLFAAALAAQTPDEFEVKLYDDRIEDIPFDEPTDLVAISIETFCAQRAYQIAHEYKKRGVKVIAGGYHPTLVPEECAQHVDAIFTGDAEALWPAVISDLKKNKLKKAYRQESHVPSEIIRFRRDIFRNKHYGPVELVQWSRGCPHNCEFCSIKSFYKSGQICRPVGLVTEEIATLRDKIVFFADDNLFQNRELLIQLLTELKPLKIKWACQVSLNIVKDDELLELMAASGCLLALLGFESFDPANLKLMNKQWNLTAMNYGEAVRKIQSFGIMVYGTFIFGYDFDTVDSFNYATEFAVKNKFFIANFNPLYPMPGSGLYKRYMKEQRLQSDWWLDENFYYGKSMFRPRGMSPEELETSCMKAKLEFNSWKSILSRSAGIFDSHHGLKDLALFFYVNFINRKEIIQKQGKYLGR